MSIDILTKQLQEPFSPDDIEWRIGAKNAKENATSGIALAYITNRAIQNRLDEIFGPFGWKNEFKEWKGNAQLCGISVNWNGEWITKWDGADDSNEEAVKGGLSDSMKRAGYQWGIGRYLYKLDAKWVPIKPQGRSYVIVEEPQLPKWALPEGYEYPKKGSRQKADPQEGEKVPSSLKAKYQLGKGSLDGLEAWVDEMKKKGLGYKQMETFLVDRLNKKREGQPA